MNDILISHFKNKNIKSIYIPNKETLFMDLKNIEDSFSGRADVWRLGNTFVLEASQMLINAINLFEIGYFDSAYYSLRSAIDLSTIIILLSDMPEKDRKIHLSNWTDQKYFPMRSKLLELLNNKGHIFVDMKSKMSEFFTDTDNINTSLNRIVHKQGFKYFYISRNHPFSTNNQEKFTNEFLNYLKKCITIVAVMRLAIDPFPILLMNKEIRSRCFDSLTEPYSEDFVQEYIEPNVLQTYKTTNLYISTFKYFKNKPIIPDVVTDVVRYQCIDSSKIEVLLEHLSLLTKLDGYPVLIVSACEKVVKVYGNNIFSTYLTDRVPNNKCLEIDGKRIINYASAKNRINQKYDYAYLSVFPINNTNYFVEHNELLDQAEINSIEQTLINHKYKFKNTDSLYEI